METETEIKIPVVREGEVVEYVDPVGRAHDAIVTNTWGTDRPSSINVVYTTTDTNARDQYGAQLLRDTSIIHESTQPAPGRFWRLK